jgi:hypothetical protein
MFVRRTLPALFLGAALLASPAAFAADAQPAAPAPAAAAPAAAPTTPPPPTPAAVAAADQLLKAMGVKQTIATIVPVMLTELEQNVTKTRPEIRDALRQSLKSIQPAFDKSAEDTYSKVEALLTIDMTEKELQDVATFLASPSGKKFLATQPIFFQQVQNIVDPWRQQISADIVARARDDLKKKGIDF